jgi:hypothetical protein
MSTVSVFSNRPAMIGDFSLDDACVAVINCDDSYDKKALELVGKEQVKAFEKRSRTWMWFVEVSYAKGAKK